ncbi:flagellar motor protein MotB [bacterium]|nr:OmpA family protein [bacterium]MBU3955633.1 flagellar motor protein MotB [bacterium]
METINENEEDNDDDDIVIESTMYDEKPVEESPVWLTIYSDLMTNLMLFFLMLYGITRMSVDMRTSILDSIAAHFEDTGKKQAVFQSFEKTAEDIKKSAAGALNNPVISDVITEPSGYRIILKAPVIFNSANAAIKSASMSDLSELAAFIKSIPNTIEIAGHTDDIPVEGTKWKSNWELSLARAESVRLFLVSKGITPERFCISGYGSTRPLYSNDSVENRLRNRRIEILVMESSRPESSFPVSVMPQNLINGAPAPQK